MKEKSIAKNTIYYIIYNVLNVVFPLFTGIYISRVLLASDIGEVAYAQNIAQYFIILAFLGLPTYGMREVAKVKNDKNKLNKLASELFSINFISTVSFLTIYLTLVFSIESFRNNLVLFLVTGISIALNALNISWLYTGLEEFRYISLRNVIFKIVAFVLLIFFVKKPEDYLIYALITVIGTTGNDVVNILMSPKFVKFEFKAMDLKRHLKPVLWLVVVNLAIEIYSLVDVTMLGFFCQKEIVTFYSYGHRIQKVLLQIVNSITMVVVPRLSSYYKDKRLSDFNSLLSNAFSTILLLSIPMIIGIWFTSDTIITTLYGDSYLKSAFVLKVLSFLLLISPTGYLLGSRVLLVIGKEKLMALCVAIGAIVNVIGNYVFIQLLQEVGASIASVISEITVCFVYIMFSRKFFKLTGIGFNVVKIFLANFSVLLFLIISIIIPVPTVIKLVIQIAGSLIIYVFMLLITKESTTFEFIKKIKARVFKEVK